MDSPWMNRMTAWQNIPRRKKIYREYSSLFPVYDDVMQQIAKKMRDAFHREDLNVTFKFRVKSFESYFNKLIRRMQNAECDDPYNITDIIGFRIICPFMEDMETAEQILRDNFTIRSSEQKGLHHTFREFGYEATHLMMDIQSYLPENETHASKSCEVQLSTTLQDAWAEVEHELVYKAGFTPFDIPLKRKLAALNANLTLADIIFQEIRDYSRSIQNQTNIRRNSLYEQISIFSGNKPQKTVEIPTGTTPAHGGAYDAIPEDSIDNVLLKAISAHNDGRYDSAITLYTRLLENKNPEYVQSVILSHRGMAFMARSKYHDAIEDFTNSVGFDPGNFRAYTYRGICYRMTGDLTRALENFQQSLEINPYQAETYYSRALVYYDMGDDHRAIEECEKALNFNPEAKTINSFTEFLRKKIFSNS